jgi:hypothetical protein
VQIYFYILPGSNMVAIKKYAFRDMESNLKIWRHSLKNKLKIQGDDTFEQSGQEWAKISLTVTTLGTWKCCWISGVRRRIK